MGEEGEHRQEGARNNRQGNATLGKKTKADPQMLLGKAPLSPQQRRPGDLGQYWVRFYNSRATGRAVHRYNHKDPTISGFPLLEIPPVPQPDLGADEKCIPIGHVVLVTTSKR